MIMIGLGAGRTGTASLANLIDSQANALCFHELNPCCAVFAGNGQFALNTISEFQRIVDNGPRNLLTVDMSRPISVKKYADLQQRDRIDLIGDIAYYYLSYVPELIALNADVRFVCIKRDKNETVASWLAKSKIHRWRSLWLADRFKSLLTRIPFHESYNFWQEHDGSRYAPNPVWDSTFPKFDGPTKKEAIEQYWDFYYAKAQRYAEQYQDFFRIFDIGALSHRDGQAAILRFLGIPDNEMVLKDAYHLHRLASNKPPSATDSA